MTLISILSKSNTTDPTTRDAAFDAYGRAYKHFGKFLSKSASTAEFTASLDILGDRVYNVVAAAAEENAVGEETDTIYSVVIAGLREAAGFDPEPQNYQVDPGHLDELMRAHQNASPEDQARLREFYERTFGQPDTPVEQQVNDPHHYDFSPDELQTIAAYRSVFAKEEEGEPKGDADSSGHKSKSCPTCKASPGEDCKKIDDEEVGGSKVHEARKEGKGSGAQPIVKLMSVVDVGQELGFFTGADDGDTFWKEEQKVDEGPDASPQIDEGKVPDDGLPPIEVPSNQNPTEQQSADQVADYNKDRPEISNTGERIDVDKPLQPEDISKPDQGSGVFPNKDQADAVTSASYKDDYGVGRQFKNTVPNGYEASDFGDNFMPEPGGPMGGPGGRAPEEAPAQHPGFKALEELKKLGVPDEEAMGLINKYLQSKENPDVDPSEPDAYGMSQGLDAEDQRSMHTVGSVQWSVL